jgi:DNA-binding transcriptional MerR regulator
MRGRSALFVAVYVDYEQEIADLVPLDDHRVLLDEGVPVEEIKPFLDDCPQRVP